MSRKKSIDLKIRTSETFQFYKRHNTMSRASEIYTIYTKTNNVHIKEYKEEYKGKI